MKRILFAALAPTALLASEFAEVKVAGHEIRGNFVTVYLEGTVKDQEVSCAVYDASGALIASNTWTTDNLATTVRVRTENADKVASARCVVND